MKTPSSAIAIKLSYQLIQIIRITLSTFVGWRRGIHRLHIHLQSKLRPMSRFAPTRLATFFASGAPRFRIPEGADAPSREHLFFLGAPFQIPRFVVSIIIDAVKLMFPTRTPTDGRNEVSEKHLKAFDPFRIYKDASSSVIMETRDVGVKASLEHPRPNTVFRDASPSFGLPMLKIARSSCLTVKASARSRTTRSYAPTRKQSFVSAIANYLPQRWSVFHNSEKAEPLSCDINEEWHPAILS